MNFLPPEKSTQNFLGLRFCGNVKHVQLDWNIIVAIIVALKRAPECIKMHHSEGEHAKIFRPKTPHGEGVLSARVPKCQKIQMTT